jgi:WD40 repeat protein
MITLLGTGPMNTSCGRFDALIARSAQLTSEEATELAAHLTGCSSCRELARAVQPVDARVAFAATGAAETMPDSPGARADHQLPEVTTDRYRITGEVGRGGIGRVLSALDQVLDRTVALKELFSANDTTRRRFIREALITARLQHPSIVPVYDAGHLGDRSPFYAMKLVAGRPLDKAIAEATTLAQRLALLPSVLAVADAIAYAHNERIIHRDLKPMNVLVGKYGETIVIDWGLAKDLGVDDREALDAGPYRATNLDQTVAGVVMGTPAYMAPEQAAGDTVDERADVYALGAILYHVISGAVPHEGTTLEEMVERVVSGHVRRLTEREPDVPRDLAAIVSKAMAVEPSARYANAQGFADDLRRFLNGQLVASHSYGTRELFRRWVKRHRAAVTVALVALAVVAVGGTVSVMRIVHAKHEADEAAAVATQQMHNATDSLVSMLQEQGRQELLAGRPARAAIYLNKAYTEGHAPDVGLRSLLADAMRSIEAQRFSLESNGFRMFAAFSPDGMRIVTADGHESKVWDSATGKVVVTLAQSDDHLAIDTASFSPDNSRIVTAGFERTARLWDARTGKLLASLEDDQRLRSAVFSPDGARIVTVEKRGIAKLWDAKTAQLVGSLEGHRDDVYSAVFSPDGTRVVTTGRDHTAKISDAKTAKLIVSLDGAVGWATFNPDGTQVITGSPDDTAIRWDAQTGKRLALLEGHTHFVDSAAFSPDGSRIVTASDDHTAKVWDARTNKLLTSLDGHTARLNSAVFSPDGSRVVTSSYDHTAKLWDVRTGRLLASFENHRADVLSAKFSPDGTQVLTASEDGTAKLWDARPSKLRLSIDAGAGKAILGDLSPDGARVVTIAEGDSTAKVWDGRSGKLLVSLAGHRGDVLFTAFDATGTRVVTTSRDQTAKLWDANTGKLLVSLDHPTKVQGATFSPNGARVVTAGTDQGARLWNANTGELIAKLDGRTDVWDEKYNTIHSAAFTTDSERVVTASDDGTARIWRTDNGKLVIELVGIGPVEAVAFSHDGERVVTANMDQSIRIWNARTGESLRSLVGHTGGANFASFSPDDTRIVTASRDQSAKLWDARTGKLLASLDGHTGQVRRAAFSSDGSRVVTASADHTAKVWDGRNGTLLASLDGHTDVVSRAAFNPSGTRVMTVSNDGTIKLWDVQLEERTPDAIGRIIAERDPWTVSNGGLVPVATESQRRFAQEPESAAPGGGSGVPTPGAALAPGAITSDDDYTTKLAAMLGRMEDLFKETDCDKLAVSLRSFTDANRPLMDALTAWTKTHKINHAALAKALRPMTKKFDDTQAVHEKCRHNKAFADALRDMKATAPP